jgi:hypothetical protein
LIFLTRRVAHRPQYSVTAFTRMMTCEVQAIGEGALQVVARTLAARL